VAFTLNIDFAGMCLFVAKPSESRMYVVLPSMGGGGEHSDHRHVPLLVFDGAHLDLKDIDPKILSGLKIHIPLRHLAFEVSGTTAPTLSLCADMADLTKVTTGHPLRDGVLSGMPVPDELASRITLKTGAIAGLFPGACWQWANTVRRVAHKVRWSAKLDGASFPLDLTALRAEGTPKTIALRPLPGSDGTITLKVHHSPPGDLPPEQGTPEKPVYNASAPHFEGYYTLFEGDPSVEVPLFRSVQGCKSEVETNCKPISDMGGSPYTCMVAGITTT
jgi:hypothetical protein